MSVATITKVALPHTSACYALTDSADFTTLATGSGNGVEFEYADDIWVFLRNSTGGNAVYTFKAPASAAQTAYGATPASPTKTVGAGKDFIARLDSIFKHKTTGKVTIECDVAAKVLVLAP